MCCWRPIRKEVKIKVANCMANVPIRKEAKIKVANCMANVPIRKEAKIKVANCMANVFTLALQGKSDELYHSSVVVVYVTLKHYKYVSANHLIFHFH